MGSPVTTNLKSQNSTNFSHSWFMRHEFSLFSYISENDPNIFSSGSKNIQF